MTLPVCCYCDAPLSCARCGCEQPADAAQASQDRIGTLEAALREIAGRSWHPANVRLGDIARAALAPEPDK